jgi:uncharacterized protein (TIGR04222 family)
MNPLDMAGPQFLIFYLVLGALTIAALVIARRIREAGEGPHVNLSDPYLIAYLRGGANEALRVATVSLVDRGLLEADGTTLKTVRDAAAAGVRRPIEKAILDKFGSLGAASSVFDDSSVAASTSELERSLRQVKLLPDAATQTARLGRLFLALAVLWGVAGLKIVVALSRGRRNVGFLVVLAIVFAIVAAAVSFRRRTARGDAVLSDVRRLFEHLRSRRSSLRRGGGTAEATLLAAAFGIAALPSLEWAYAQSLYPRAARSSSSSCGSSCGSSSSCSSSSSCGGGSCGGGGCGGCGS